jgi:hypothetical protein
LCLCVLYSVCVCVCVCVCVRARECELWPKKASVVMIRMPMVKIQKFRFHHHLKSTRWTQRQTSAIVSSVSVSSSSRLVPHRVTIHWRHPGTVVTISFGVFPSHDSPVLPYNSEKFKDIFCVSFRRGYLCGFCDREEDIIVGFLSCVIAV